MVKRLIWLLTLLLSVEIECALGAEPCPQIDANGWTPLVKIHDSSLPTASADVPAIVDFGGDTQYYVTVFRTRNENGASGPPGRYRLRVLRKEKLDEAFEIVCDTDWQTDPMLSAKFAFSSKNPEVIGWRAEIYDERTYGANALRVAVLPASVTRTNSPARGNAEARGTKLECSASGDTGPGSPAFIPALSESIQIDDDATAIRYVRGGNRLALNAKVPVGTLWSRTSIAVSAKGGFGGPFSGTCEYRLPLRPGTTELDINIDGGATGADSPTIWRLEFSGPDQRFTSPAPAVEFTAATTRPRNSNAGAGRLPSPEFDCYSTRATRATHVSDATNVFAGSTLLSVSVGDAIGQLTPAARQKLRSILLSAVSLWRASCRKCNADHLAILNLDGQMYVLAPILEAFRTQDPAAYSRPPGFNIPPYGGLLTSLASPVRPPFVSADPSHPSLIRLCGYDDQDLPSQLARIRSALSCSNAPPADSGFVARMQLNVLPGFTNCGPDKNVIACERDASVVQLNARDYAYITQDTKIVFGRGTTKVSLLHVLVHEVGHWIGLNHISSWGNIMSETMEDSRCIDGVNVNAIIAAAQGGVYGMQDPTAFLLRPRVIKEKPKADMVSLEQMEEEARRPRAQQTPPRRFPPRTQ